MSFEEPPYLEKLAAWRTERDSFFANHYATPLSDEALAEFVGLTYFPADPRLLFNVRLVRSAEAVLIESSAGSMSDYPDAGFVKLGFSDGPVTLRVLEGEEDDLFVPFRDATCGISTYSGGRYVPAERQTGGFVTVDFNKATNPYCAYDPDFSCPLPPPENHLSFAVEAGELNW